MEITTSTWILIIILSYLLGSIPSAYLVGRINGINVFAVGSGNMGATNVARAVGAKWGFVTAALDIAKGIVAVLLSRLIANNDGPGVTTVSALTAIIGHNWSLIATALNSGIRDGRLYIQIRGGKGAAIAYGTFITVAPAQVVIGMIVIASGLMWLTRYMSLGVLVAMGIGFVWMLILIQQGSMPMEWQTYMFGVVALIVVRFLGNIRRLLTGTERKVGNKA